jgi:hypothetical protein
MNEHQQSPEEITRGVLGALRAQATDLLSSSLFNSAHMVATYFCALAPPVLRHVPRENAHMHTGWVTGANGIRSYYDVCRTYWTWTSYVHIEGVSVDPILRQASFLIDVYWEWRNPSRGPPWIERINCTQTYDSDFKITIADFVTLSGASTNLFMVGKNLRLHGSPAVKSEKSTVCMS